MGQGAGLNMLNLHFCGFYGLNPVVSSREILRLSFAKAKLRMEQTDHEQQLKDEEVRFRRFRQPKGDLIIFNHEKMWFFYDELP